MYQPIDVNRVIKEYHITATAARLLSLLNNIVWASHLTGKHDRRGIAFCYASKKTLAERLDKSVRTVARALAELKACGLIVCQRTTRNAHIYVTYYGSNGTSETAKNGTSNNELSINNNNQTHMSINHPCGEDGLTENGQDMPAAAPIGSEAAQDAQEGGQAASSTSAPARAAAPAPRHDLQGEAQALAGTQAASSAPDLQRGAHGQRLQRRPRQAARAAQEGGQRPRSEAASEAREALERVLEQRLELGSIVWSMPEFEAEARQKYALVRLIADAATEGRQIRVNGCGLTGAQFWNEAQHINLRTASDVLERVERAEMRGTIGNLRAYTLAAIYNGCQLDRVMRQA